MKGRAYYTTIEDLARGGRGRIPSRFKTCTQLIYSSPATLAFNSPGAEGFGVKRAGLAVPGSVMLIVSPGCCGRNTSLISRMPEYKNRFFYLNLEEKDVITGRHLNNIPQAVKEIYDCLDTKPPVFMICITCVDALLGTDMERVCRKAQELVNIPVRPCYMYALTREGTRPPMVHVRQSIYCLLQKGNRIKESANILGFFSPLEKDCELFCLLKAMGIENIRQIGACRTYEEFLRMNEANFNVLLNSECRPAADDMAKKLGIPYIELARIYDVERNRKQYSALAKALNTALNTDEFYEQAKETSLKFASEYRGLKLAIGECINADAFELALALALCGLCVSEIFATVTDENFVWIRALSEVSPDTRVYSNTEPTMLYYNEEQSDAEFALGADARYYHPSIPGISFNGDVQPFGFSGTISLYRQMAEALKN